MATLLTTNCTVCSMYECNNVYFMYNNMVLVHIKGHTLLHFIVPYLWSYFITWAEGECCISEMVASVVPMGYGFALNQVALICLSKSQARQGCPTSDKWNRICEGRMVVCQAQGMLIFPKSIKIIFSVKTFISFLFNGQTNTSSFLQRVV